MERIIDLIDASSLPRTHILLKSKHISVKIVWFVFTIILSTLTIKFVIGNISNYYNYEVVTNINIIQEIKSQFPAVSFCFHTVDSEKLDDIIQMNRTIIYCKLELRNCNWTEFELYTDESNNVCYRFNSGKNSRNNHTEIRSISRNDIEAGLFVSINIDKQEENLLWQMYVSIQNASDTFRRDQTYNIETGIRIPRVFYILNQLIFSIFLFIFKYFYLAGTTFIQVQREFVQKLPDPYNDCVKQVCFDVFNFMNSKLLIILSKQLVSI